MLRQLLLFNQYLLVIKEDPHKLKLEKVSWVFRCARVAEQLRGWLQVNISWCKSRPAALFSCFTNILRLYLHSVNRKEGGRTFESSRWKLTKQLPKTQFWIDIWH